VNNDQKSSFILFDILYILTDNKLIVHLGGKIMHHFKALGVISLILGFALVTFGCATSKLVSSKNQVSDFPSDIEISAETVPEGILLTFSNYSNIPQEMDYLTVVFTSWYGSEEPDWETNDQLGVMNLLSNRLDAQTWENVIEQVRQTGTVTFPFVQPGQRYIIRAVFVDHELINEKSYDSKGIATLYTECVADGGIYLNKNISLNMNNDRTGVSLSSEPVFTTDVQFGELKVLYNIIIHKGDYTEAFTNYTDDLLWNFEPSFREYLTKEGVINGNYPAIAGASLNIIHDNISWIMEIAHTPLFTYSF
jgi:hypothetical protein